MAQLFVGRERGNYASIPKAAGRVARAPFEHLFYTYVFEGLAASGSCFGMCLVAAFARVGRTLFAEPIVTYGCDTPAIQDINI